jgi:hypothetical protein
VALKVVDRRQVRLRGVEQIVRQEVRCRHACTMESLHTIRHPGAKPRPGAHLRTHVKKFSANGRRACRGRCGDAGCRSRPSARCSTRALYSSMM